MLKGFYAIQDNKADTHPIVFTATNEAIALRMLEDQMLDERSPYRMHPKDYSLWCVGTWDEDNGLVEGIKKIKIMECELIAKNFEGKDTK